MQNIVILGAGFGGLKTALKLSSQLKKSHNSSSVKTSEDKDEWAIILIDKNTYHTYTPALYEAASAYQRKSIKDIQKFEEVLGGAVCLPSAEIVGDRNITFTQGEVSDIDFWNNKVKLESGDSIPYEYLVFALGSETVYFGIQGAEKCCYALKTLRDAFRIRRRIEDIFADAKKGEPIRIVIVGGGATGVEVIAEIATYTRHLAQDYKFDYKDIKISLFEARSTILASFAKSQRDAVVRRLKKLGVDVFTSTRIEKVLPECVLFEEGEKCDADLILWGGGTKGPYIFSQIKGLELDKRGRIAVDGFLQAKGLRKVFAIGDNAIFIDGETSNPAPATAFIAEQQADVVAANINRALTGQPFAKYKVSIPGYVISCGGKYAVARIFGITFSGFFGWAVKKLIDLRYFFSVLPLKKAFSLWLMELRLFTRND